MLLLITDDDRSAAETLAELLPLLLPAPVEVVLAFNGKEAIAAATGSRTPDAVIMDVEMPVMDGINAAIQIRRELGGRTPTLIAATGRADMLERATVNTAYDHALLKPLNVDELLGLLQPRA